MFLLDLRVLAPLLQMDVLKQLFMTFSLVLITGFIYITQVYLMMCVARKRKFPQNGYKGL